MRLTQSPGRLEPKINIKNQHQKSAAMPHRAEHITLNCTQYGPGLGTPGGLTQSVLRWTIGFDLFTEVSTWQLAGSPF
jgi:hypothetical protein